MKKILLLTFAVIGSLFLLPEAKAQHHGGCPMHHHNWSSEDSVLWNDFTCKMNDFHMDDFPFFKHRKKYNGHWAGVELGMSGYVTPDFKMNFYPDYPYLNTNTARSLMVNLNPFEINANLWSNHLGFTTGIGFQINNYYFTNNYIMLQDSSTLVAYKVQDAYGNPVSFRVNKLVASYFNIPLLFEYQTNRYRRVSSFHITIGVIAGVRIGSYTKQIYDNKQGSYYLVDEKGNRIATYEVEHYMVRDRGSYHLAPFKLDAAFRIGWSHLNLFATYSLTKMFQDNQGPELYPFTLGLTLLGW